MPYLDGAPDRGLLPVADALYAASFSLLLLLVCVPGTHTGRLLSSKVAVWLGTVSYSLYLIHYPILLALGPTIAAHASDAVTRTLLTACIGLPVVFACTWVFHLLFERPFLVQQKPAPGGTG
jgi:peptidoglycan/LPS O-acetylase OafA/YrhL